MLFFSRCKIAHSLLNSFPAILLLTHCVSQTYVYYVDKTTASVFKSPSNTAPMKMRFKMTYKTGHEYSYIEVKPKQHCIVQGSDQWPNLVQVDYFKLAKKER